METTIVKRQPTLPKQSLIAEYRNLGKPDLILTSLQPKSHEEVLESNHPTLGELASISENNRAFTLSFIANAITKYLEYVGRQRTPNDPQVAEIAELMLDEYPHLKFDDMAFFIRQCKLARFGKFYNLNGAVLMEWLAEYNKQRTAAYIQLRERQEHDQRKAEAQAADDYWKSLTPKQREEQKRQLEEIQQRIAHKLSIARRNQ